MASESKVMNPQKVTKNIRFFDVFSARRTFAMGPRMAQALKNQEHSMLFTTCYAKIKKTTWFYLLFCAPVDDLARLTGAQNGPNAQKTKKNRCFSLLVMQKSRKLNGFAHFFVPPATTSPGSLGPRMGPMLQKPRKLNAFHYFLCKNQENSMVLPTFVCPR